MSKYIKIDTVANMIKNKSLDDDWKSELINSLYRLQSQYDVDKVMEELEDLQTYTDNGYFSNNNDIMWSCDDVREIVKKGGIDD